MSLFHHVKIHFQAINPFTSELAEEIAAEQAEPEAIVLEESIDGAELDANWSHMVEEFRDDPDMIDLHS